MASPRKKKASKKAPAKADAGPLADATAGPLDSADPEEGEKAKKQGSKADRDKPKPPKPPKETAVNAADGDHSDKVVDEGVAEASAANQAGRDVDHMDDPKKHRLHGKKLKQDLVDPNSGETLISSGTTIGDAEVKLIEKTRGDHVQVGFGTKPVAVPLKGKQVIVNPEQVLVLALIALEDPKVDAVLSACGVVVKDIDGTQIWP